MVVSAQSGRARHHQSAVYDRARIWDGRIAIAVEYSALNLSVTEAGAKIMRLVRNEMLYIGGGNAEVISFELPSNVRITSLGRPGGQDGISEPLRDLLPLNVSVQTAGGPRNRHAAMAFAAACSRNTGIC
jgi:hypothetical protein